MATRMGWMGSSMFSQEPFLAGPRVHLGQAEQQWFARAKAAVAMYDNLVERIRRIASPPVREDLLSRFVGNPNNPESAVYRRNSVAFNVSEAESYTPVNYLVYQPDRVKNRVTKLENWDRELREEVEAAERTYGLLPEPVVVERVVEKPAPPKEAPLTVPLVIGGLVLVGVALLAFGD